MIIFGVQRCQRGAKGDAQGVQKASETVMEGPGGLESSPNPSPPMVVTPRGPFWSNFGTPWGVLLGPLWVYFRVQILERFRGPFRARWGVDLGPILAPFWVAGRSKNGPKTELGKGTPLKRENGPKINRKGPSATSKILKIVWFYKLF